MGAPKIWLFFFDTFLRFETRWPAKRLDGRKSRPLFHALFHPWKIRGGMGEISESWFRAQSRSNI